MTTKRDTNTQLQTASPLTIPSVPEPARFTPEFLRLPKPGAICPYTGMSRSAINDLILPSEKNGNKPPVKSFCLRQKGAKTGIRLVDYASLREYILSNVAAN